MSYRLMRTYINIFCKHNLKKNLNKKKTYQHCTWVWNRFHCWSGQQWNESSSHWRWTGRQIRWYDVYHRVWRGILNCKMNRQLSPRNHWNNYENLKMYLMQGVSKMLLKRLLKIRFFTIFPDFYRFSVNIFPISTIKILREGAQAPLATP